MKDNELKRIYGEILIGYSSCIIDGKETYIRHFGPRQQAYIDSQYAHYLQHYVDEGIETEEDRLKEVLKSGIWTQDKEDSIVSLKGEILKLRNTESKLMFEIDKKPIQDRIQSKTKELQDLWIERTSMIGRTANAFADRKINELYVYSSLFEDPDFIKPLYSWGEWSELEEEDVIKVSDIYNKIIYQFEEDCVKHVSLLNIFQSYFALAGEDGFTFFNKPIIDLTFFQSQLVSYGRYFRSILNSDKKPPADVIGDPDKLIKWFDSSRKIEAATNKADGGTVGFVGATNEEIAANTGTVPVDFVKEAAKSGGKLKMNQIGELLGF